MNHLSMLALSGRAFSSVMRHAPLYIALCTAIIGINAVAAYQWHAAVALPFLTFTLDPIFAAIIFSVSLADFRGETRAADIWLRILERAWAVIIIDFISTFIASSALAGLGSNLLDKIVAITLFLTCATIIFADVHAVADDEVAWWMLIPRAFGQSLRTALAHGNFSRAMLVLTLQFVPALAGNSLESILQLHHVALASFWGNVPLGTIMSPPLLALTAFVYFDAAGYEPKRTCGE